MIKKLFSSENGHSIVSMIIKKIEWFSLSLKLQLIDKYPIQT
ncbi:hypothetical protein FHS70_001002 [Flammeovirga yaeyamensis]|nr:hypothetical protein [Flammeovirga yaeyamensis]